MHFHCLLWPGMLGPVIRQNLKQKANRCWGLKCQSLEWWGPSWSLPQSDIEWSATRIWKGLYTPTHCSYWWSFLSESHTAWQIFQRRSSCPAWPSVFSGVKAHSCSETNPGKFADCYTLWPLWNICLAGCRDISPEDIRGYCRLRRSFGLFCKTLQ